MGCIYLLQVEGTTQVKIGYSENVAVRVRTLRTANPLPLRILREIQSPAARALDQTLRQRYVRYHIHGDWFDFPPDILQQLLEEHFD